MVHHLNPSATIIFDLCDGTRSPEKIADVLAEAYKLDTPPLEQVIAGLRDLADRELIRWNDQDRDVERPDARGLGAAEEASDRWDHHVDAIAFAHQRSSLLDEACGELCVCEDRLRCGSGLIAVAANSRWWPSLTSSPAAATGMRQPEHRGRTPRVA